MPKFHFVISNGHRIEDPEGFNLPTQAEAECLAHDIAKQIALDVCDTPSRKVLVVTDAGDVVYEAPIVTGQLKNTA
jgi:hypothetical protein